MELPTKCDWPMEQQLTNDPVLQQQQQDASALGPLVRNMKAI
jgi:hypothetical protein